MTDPTLEAIGQQLIDQVNRAVERTRQQAEEATAKLQRQGWFSQPGHPQPEPDQADEERIRRILADPVLRTKVLALLDGTPAVPSGG